MLEENMDALEYSGWEKAYRFIGAGREMIVVTSIGPRVMRYAFEGEQNMFREFEDQLGGSGEQDWQIRGGHRFWIAPELPEITYEPDNEPVPAEAGENSLVIRQPAGAKTGVSKTIRIGFDPADGSVVLDHTLRNEGKKSLEAAPWALSVMNQNGQAVIPLPAFIAHSERLLHNQEWSLWGYTDLSDPRWTITPSYLFLRQDPGSGPTKLGIAHREGWVAYQIGEFVFIKSFRRKEDGVYPDGNVNFEIFSNEEILELESLGSLGTLEAGAEFSHRERWCLHRNIPSCSTPEDVDRYILPLAQNLVERDR